MNETHHTIVSNRPKLFGLGLLLARSSRDVMSAILDYLKHLGRCATSKPLMEIFAF